MPDRSEIRHARRALGAELARLRKAAGFTQHELAAKIDGYGRSTVASTETEHQSAHRDFWLRCDAALAPNGALIAAYDDLREFTHTTYVGDADLDDEAALLHRPSPVNDHEDWPGGSLAHTGVDGV